MQFFRTLFLAIVFFIVFVPIVVFAENSGDSVEFVFGNDFYSAGDFVELKSEAEDDVFLAGAIVNVVKNVANDLTAVGSSLTINSTIGDDLRVAGSVVTLISQIGGDVLVAGGVVNFASNSTVAGDAFFAGGLLNFGGAVAGDLNLIGDKINFSGVVDGDAVIRVGQNLNFFDDANISGKLTYFAEKEIEIPEGVANEVEFKNLEKTVAGATGKMNLDFVSFARILLFVISFVTGAVLLAIYGRGSEIFVETIRTKFWWSLIVGALAIFIPFIAIVLLLATVVGSILAVLVGLAWIIFLVIAGILGGFTVGSFIFSQKTGTRYFRKLLALFIGGVLLIAASFLPVFGGALRIVVFVLTLGATILTEIELYKRMKKAKIL